MGFPSCMDGGSTPWMNRWMALPEDGSRRPRIWRPVQIHRGVVLADRWCVEGPVRVWRISTGVPVAAYVFMARLRAVLASHEIRMTRLPVKITPDYGLGGRWRRL